VTGAVLAAEAARVTAFRQRAGIPALIDAHAHFMPERLLAAVWAYPDAAGPLTGCPWPITYRLDEDARVAVLRGLGIRRSHALPAQARTMTRPRPCSRRPATRLPGQAPAWMPARAVPPAARPDWQAPWQGIPLRHRCLRNGIKVNTYGD
jgi:hypothetical protein